MVRFQRLTGCRLGNGLDQRLLRQHAKAIICEAQSGLYTGLKPACPTAAVEHLAANSSAIAPQP
jgi:hypothetical protein